MSPLFRSKGREEAESALRSCDETLAILESGTADLGPAQRLRERSADLAGEGAYREATEAARKAEETARLLDRIHTAATEGLTRLKSERTRMARLGMAVSEVDDLIERAGSWMSRTSERFGDPRFPAYSKAGELALQGLRLAKERIPRFKGASAVVFEAEQALRQMAESNRFVDKGAFEFLVLKPAADALGDAKAKLQANAFSEAEDRARWTLAAARQIETTYGRVTRSYEGVAEGAKAFRSEGGTATEVEDLLAVSRLALEKGKFDEAADIAERAGGHLREVREEYRSLVLKQRTAEDAIREVETWGFNAKEPRAILQDARSLMVAGKYREAAVRVEEARHAAQALRETHRASAARIAEMRRSIVAVRSTSPRSAAEADALLTRAETLLEEGRYRACEENLQIASLLLVDVDTAKPPGPPPGLASILQAAREIEPTCPTCDGPLANDGTCPTCSALPEPANPEPLSPIRRAVEDAKRVVAAIERDHGTLAEQAAAAVQGCAMCGGPLGGEDLLCVTCQGNLKGSR